MTGYPWLAGDQLNAADLDAIAPTLIKSFTAAENLGANIPICLRTIQSDGGIQYDTGSTGNATGTNGTVNNISITIGANSNRILMVQVATNNSVGAFSITFNGVSPTSTLANNVGTSAGTSHSVFLWIAPATGTHNLVITIGNNNGLTYNVAFLSLYNVSQSGQPSQSNGTAADTPATVTLSTAGAVSIICLAGSGGSVLTTGAQVNAQSNSNAYMAWSDIMVPLGVYAGSRTATHYCAFVAEFQPANAVTGYGVGKASSANPTFRNNLFLGFTASAVSSGQSVNGYIGGLVTGMSGLIVGADYYLNDALGIIGTSPGTNLKKIGFALSATTLFLTNNF